MDQSIYVLGIESSCDETAASVCKDGIILSNVIASQAIHSEYGGVVPELASRAHMQNIVPVVDKAIKESGIDLKSLNGIAFTQSPGLIGALLVGAGFAKSLAMSLKIPLLAVHHMQAHVLSNLIEEPKPSFPFLCLTISGGHTQIVLCNSPLSMEVIGETIDDAAGEAFDKTAKMLRLPYPGGPLVDEYAQQGDPKRFHFPEPQIEDLNFSFSGVKTSVLYFLQKQKKEDPEFVEKNIHDICASIQYSIINILMNKLKKASIKTGINNICIAGGVAANKGLRNALTEHSIQYNWKIHTPSMQYCTDNAAMIAITGYYKLLSGFESPLTISSSARASWH